MIETLKYATISQISTKDLRFYDPDDIAGSMDFCTNLGITYLPDRTREHCYELVGSSFVLRQLNEIEQCNPWDRIFSEDTLAKFQKNNSDNVLFVTEANHIKGVVHIVDYNRAFVFTEFYRLIFGFETMLRKFLLLKGVNNESIRKFYKFKAGEEGAKNFWKKRYKEFANNEARLHEKQNILGPLQIFYLSDLLNYYVFLDMIADGEKKSILNVRNRIAHSVDIISNRMNEQAEKLYNFKGLQSFVRDSVVFFNHFEKLSENLKDLEYQVV